MSDVAVELERKQRVSGVTTREVWCGNGHHWTETWTVPAWAHGPDPWNFGVWLPDNHLRRVVVDGRAICGQCWLRMEVHSDVA